MDELIMAAECEQTFAIWKCADCECADDSTTAFSATRRVRLQPANSQCGSARPPHPICIITAITNEWLLDRA
jgi:hypothetical protein